VGKRLKEMCRMCDVGGGGGLGRDNSRARLHLRACTMVIFETDSDYDVVGREVCRTELKDRRPCEDDVKVDAVM
jgi:hypothetical protein